MIYRRTTLCHPSVHTPTVAFDHFEPLSFPLLNEVVSHWKSTRCTLDIILSRLQKDIFDSAVMSVLSITNRSRQSWSIPADFKHAVVEHILKEQNLDPRGKLVIQLQTSF